MGVEAFSFMAAQSQAAPALSTWWHTWKNLSNISSRSLEGFPNVTCDLPRNISLRFICHSLVPRQRVCRGKRQGTDHRSLLDSGIGSDAFLPCRNPHQTVARGCLPCSGGPLVREFVLGDSLRRRWPLSPGRTRRHLLLASVCGIWNRVMRTRHRLCLA